MPLLLAGALLLPVLATGCGGDDDPLAPSTPGIVTGSVLTVAGEGVEGALLTLTAGGEPTRTVTSGPDGGFRIEGVAPGTYLLEMDPPAGWVRAPAESGSRSIPLAAGATTSHTFRLAPAEGTGILSGWVHHDGRGVAEVRVVLRGSGGEELELITDEDGLFDFPGLAPGGRTLEVHPPTWFQLRGGQPGSRLVTVPSFGRTTVEIELLPFTAQEVFEISIEPTQTFTPFDITVPPGARILWTNADVETHTITPDMDTAWERREVSQEEEVFEVTLNNPGVYHYHCELHKAGGMTGVIRVQP